MNGQKDGSQTGLPAALRQVEPFEDLPAGVATDQLPLWPAARLEERPAGPGPIRPRWQSHPLPGRLGRPPGTRKRSNSAWVAWLRARYRSPLELLAETYSRPVGVLAEELGCTCLEAFKLQILAAATLAPYLHSRQPQALQLEQGQAVHLSIELAAGSEENQRVIDGVAGEVDSSELDR